VGGFLEILLNSNSNIGSKDKKEYEHNCDAQQGGLCGISGVAGNVGSTYFEGESV